MAENQQLKNFDVKEIAKYVKQWGGSPSIALLDSNCEIFKHPGIDGLIGYRSEAGDAFVFGDPVCEPGSKIKLAKAFDEFCKEKKQTIIYTQVSDEFGQWALKYYDGALVEIGQDYYVNPQNNPTEGSEARMLRKKVNHALHEGSIVLEYTGMDIELENALEELKNDWLKSRKGPQIYLSSAQLFENREGKRWFYAKQGNVLVGLCMLNRLEARKGWVLNLLMATNEAAHGITELLVVSVLDQLRKENCEYLTFGVVTSKDLNQIIGLSNFSTWLARTAFKGAKWIFNLDGRRKYWEKYKPKGESSHVLFTHRNVSLCDVFGLMRAMNARL